MPNPINIVRDYIQSSAAELKKVNWPSRSMTTRYSVMVIVASLALAGFFAALDFGFSNIVSAVLSQKASSATQQAPTPETVPTVDVDNAGDQTVQVTNDGATPAASEPLNLPAGTGEASGGITLPPLEKK
jgi:preprotein translocase SecE subunit